MFNRHESTLHTSNNLFFLLRGNRVHTPSTCCCSAPRHQRVCSALCLFSCYSQESNSVVTPRQVLQTVNISGQVQDDVMRTYEQRPARVSFSLTTTKNQPARRVASVMARWQTVTRSWIWLEGKTKSLPQAVCLRRWLISHVSFTLYPCPPHARWLQEKFYISVFLSFAGGPSHYFLGEEMFIHVHCPSQTH